MKSLATAQRDGAALGEEPVRLEVLLVYEDFVTGLRARQAFEHAVRQLEVKTEFQLSAWRFDLLSDSTLRDEAAAEARQADLLLISAHGREDLPGSVGSWFRQWLGSKPEKPCALVLSLDPASRGSAPANRTHASLRKMAQPAGVEVLLHFGEALPGPGLAAWSLPKTPPANTSLEILLRVEPHPHWGLNE